MENQLEIYKSVIEDAVDSIFIGDAKGNFVLVNKSAETLTGYNRDELLSLQMNDLFPKELLQKYPLNYEALNSGAVITMNREIIRKNGELVHVEMKSKRLPDGRYQSFIRDNSERLNKEIELKESEEKYKTLFEFSPSGILIIASDGKIISANSAINDLLGYEHNELIGKNVINLSHPDNRGDVKTNIENILSGNNLHHVVKSVKKDGTTIFNSLYERKITLSEYGDCILSIANDITNQIIAENELKEIEAKQRNILEHSNNVFYSHTTDHKITYISPQIKQLLDYEVEEAMVKWTDLATDNPMNQIGFEKTVKAINTGIPQAPYELELIGKTRKKVVVEVHEAPVVENGKTIGIVGALIDITEKKKAEIELVKSKELFQFAIEGSDVGMWDWDIKQGKTKFSSRIKTMLGYTSNDEFIPSDSDWPKIIHPEDFEKSNLLISKHLKGELSFYQCETRMKHKSGNWVWILVRGKVAEWDDQNQPVRMVGTHLDITDRKRMEKELRNSEERFKSLFEDAAVPIWLEDFSELKIRFDELKNAGIKDFKKYFDENPKEVAELAVMVKVVDVNKKSLELFNTPDKESLVKDISRYFSTESIEVFKEELVSLANGKDTFVSDIPVVTPSGETFHLIINLSVPPTYLKTLDRVLVSFVDITERKKNSQIIRKYAREIETFFSLSQNMIRNLNSQELIKIIPEQAVKAMENVEAASLWKLNYEEKVFQPISWFGYKNLDISNTRLSLEDTLIGKIYTTKKSFICNNTELEPSFKRIDILNSSLIKSTIGLPLIVNEEVLAIVFTDNLSETNIFDEEDFKVLQSFVNFSAVALNNAQLYDMLKKSEQKYHSIIDSIGESIVIHDFETSDVLDVNKKMLDMYGLSYEEALTVNLNDISLGVYPYTGEEESKLIDKAKTEGPQLFEWHAKKKNGELFWTEVNLSRSKVGNDERIIAVVRDIDERKKIEAAIKESEAKIESMMRSAPVGIGFIKNRVLEYVNENLVETLGYTKEEMIGQSSQKFYESSDEFKRLGGLYSKLKEKNIISSEARLKKKSGDLIDVIISISAIDKIDNKKGVIFSVLDITENKVAQQNLIVERARYKNLFENSPVPLWEADYSQIIERLESLKESGIANLSEYIDLNPSFLLELSSLLIIIDVNKATLNLHRAKDKSHLYTELTNIFTDNSLQILKEIVVAIFEGKNYFSSASEIKTLEGEIRFVDLRLYMEFDTSLNNTSYKALLATIDITDRRLAEIEIANQLNRNITILNTMNDGFILTDDQGNIVDVNPSYCNLVGYTAEELIQMNIREIDVSIPADEVDRRIKQMISKGSDTFNTKHKTKEGEIIDLAVSIAVNRFEHKTLVTCFMRDITLQNMALQELNKSREEIGELAQYLQEVREEERQRIATEIHDDLGQALTALKLDTSILLNKVSNNDHTIISKLKSMKDLADQSIKTVQKISSDLRPGILDDLGLTAALEWETNKFEERTGIRCNLIISPYDISFDDKINITVFRLVQEACTNVARHSKATKLEITITKDLTKLNLVIKDNGIGITSEQINNSKSFGLFGMRERLRNLKGGINFTGESNKGTTVNIVIPLNSVSKK